MWKSFVPFSYSGTAVLSANEWLDELEKFREWSQELEESEERLDDLKDFRIVIPMSEIVSARLFDLDVYERFQEES